MDLGSITQMISALNIRSTLFPKKKSNLGVKYAVTYHVDLVRQNKNANKFCTSLHSIIHVFSEKTRKKKKKRRNESNKIF